MFKRFSARLQNKLIAGFVLVLLIPIVVITVYSNNSTRAAIIQRYRTQQTDLLATRSTGIETTLQDAINKLKIIHTDQTVQNYKLVLEGVNVQDRTVAVQTFFANFLKNTPGLKDLRIIDKTGQEVIRVDNTSGSPRVVTGSELENKATRPYFINTITLPDGQIYSSGLDLNVDQGKLDQPYVPVIRYATPLYGSDKTVIGILVLKLFAAPLLADATASVEPGATFYVLNSDGSYWWNSDPAKLYSNVLNTGYSFNNDYPNTAAYINTSKLDDTFVPDPKDRPDTFQFFARVNPAGQDLHWLIYYELPQSLLFTELNNTSLGIVTLSVLLLLSGIIAAALLSRSVAQPIRAVSEAMVRLGKREWDTPIPTSTRNDEVGQLTQAAGSMAKDIGVAYNNLEKQTQELRVANAMVKESARLKSEFMSTMSHELRTPLNAMLGFTSILLEGMGGEIDADARHMIERIGSNSERLLNLINGVLDIAKIEAGRLEIQSEPFDPRELADTWNMQMNVLAEKKGLAFEIEIDPQMPEQLYGDKERLSQIAINLLSNAFKFTNKGTVTLSLKTNAQSWLIAVADTGVGIPPHALNYIFDEFRQVDGSSTRAYGGTGLGLAIVRNLCEMMDGNIKVTSELNQGSTFTVTLPLKPVAELVLA